MKTIVSVVLVCIFLASCSVKEHSGLTLTKLPQTFCLENPTEKDKFERMMYVALFDGGEAQLAPVPVSSYLLPQCTYSVEDGKLLINAAIKTEFDESFFGVKNNEVIARFVVLDENTLIFESATVPLFADTGARYVYTID